MNNKKKCFGGWNIILILAFLIFVFASTWQIVWAGGPGDGACQCQGDLDNDQDLDGWDLLDFSFYYANQNLEADLNGDNLVDVADLEVFAGDYGRNDCPSCDDGNACTEDFCDPATGECQHVPVSCDDGNACTMDSCDPQSGCFFTVKNCDDGDPCTEDVCDSQLGCQHKDICQ